MKEADETESDDGDCDTEEEIETEEEQTEEWDEENGQIEKGDKEKVQTEEDGDEKEEQIKDRDEENEQTEEESEEEKQIEKGGEEEEQSEEGSEEEEQIKKGNEEEEQNEEEGDEGEFMEQECDEDIAIEGDGTLFEEEFISPISECVTELGLSDQISVGTGTTDLTCGQYSVIISRVSYYILFLQARTFLGTNHLILWGAGVHLFWSDPICFCVNWNTKLKFLVQCKHFVHTLPFL